MHLEIERPSTTSTTASSSTSTNIPKTHHYAPSYLEGRKIVYLPTDEKYREEWEALGIKWLEPLDGGAFFAKALLPEGWETNYEPSTKAKYPYSADQKNIVIYDNAGNAKVSMLLTTSYLNQKAIVFFPTLDGKLPKHKEQYEPKKAEYDPRRIDYTDYLSEFYCSYNEIVEALESWGKVEAILRDGSDHIFVVRFNKPIKISNDRDAIDLNTNTPFNLVSRRMDSTDNYYSFFSNNLITFEIRLLDHFNECRLGNSLIPDKLADKLQNEEYLVWSNVIESLSDTEKAKILLESIRKWGLKILERGCYKPEYHNYLDYPVEKIIFEYTEKCYFPWEVIMRAQQ